MSKTESQLRDEVERSQERPGCVRVGTSEVIVTTHETFVGSEGLEIGTEVVFVGSDDMYGVSIA